MEAHLHVYERAALGGGQLPVLEAARRWATPLQFLELVAPVDHSGVLQWPPSERRHYLGIDVANLERLAANLYGDRPPLRVRGGVADERPDLVQRRIKMGLRAVVRHHAIFAESDGCKARRKSAARP